VREVENVLREDGLSAFGYYQIYLLTAMFSDGIGKAACKPMWYLVIVAI
jgi:hypothetical protein